MALTTNVMVQEIAGWCNVVSGCEVNKVELRTNVISYQDENGVNKLEYRQLPYY